MKNNIAIGLAVLCVICIVSLIVYELLPSDIIITVCPSGCDYSSLGQAVEAEKRDVTSLRKDGCLIFQIVGEWADTIPVIVEGYVTSPKNYIVVRGPKLKFAPDIDGQTRGGEWDFIPTLKCNRLRHGRYACKESQ